MTLISSFRPHQPDSEYRENQIRALRSWEKVVGRIVYFGVFEPELAGPRVEFMGDPNWPRISEMARFAATADKVSGIVNSDIVLLPEAAKVFEIVANTSIGAATSRRFDLESGQLDPDDKGRDIFICKRRIWKMVADHVPVSCRMGHQQWDSWMVGFLRFKLDKRFAEFTQTRTVYHPRHENRKMPYAEEIDISGPFQGYWDGTQDTQIA